MEAYFRECYNVYCWLHAFKLTLLLHFLRSLWLMRLYSLSSQTCAPFLRVETLWRSNKKQLYALKVLVNFSNLSPVPLPKASMKSKLKCCFTSTETVGLLGTWAQDGHLQQRYPFLSACVLFVCVQTMVWLPVFRIFNMSKDVDACDFTWGLYGQRKRSWLWYKNPLPHLGLEPVSVLRLALYQLSYPCH